MCTIELAMLSVAAASTVANFAQAQEQADAQTQMHNNHQKTAMEDLQRQT